MITNDEVLLAYLKLRNNDDDLRHTNHYKVLKYI